MFPICFKEENIEREQVIVSSSLRQGITFLAVSSIFYCDDNKHLLATDEIRYLQRARY